MDSNINNKNLESKLSSALYIISTPIGNIDDITLRSINILKDVDILYCENPNYSLRLLKHFNIDKKMKIYNDQSNKNIRNDIINFINNGLSVGLISDAGTPLICDPGYKLARSLIDNNLPIYSIPGPCALVTALTLSGISSDQFSFMGFPPRKDGQLKSFFEKIININHTLIFYESPHRIKNFFKIAKTYLPNCPAFLARELTKIYEDKIYGTISEIYEKIQDYDNLRGEMVVIIENNNNNIHDNNLANDMHKVIMSGLKYLSVNDLSKFLHEVTGMKKTDIYNLANSLKNNIN